MHKKLSRLLALLLSVLMLVSVLPTAALAADGDPDETAQQAAEQAPAEIPEQPSEEPVTDTTPEKPAFSAEDAAKTVQTLLQNTDKTEFHSFLSQLEAEEFRALYEHLKALTDEEGKALFAAFVENLNDAEKALIPTEPVAETPVEETPAEETPAEGTPEQEPAAEFLFDGSDEDNGAIVAYVNGLLEEGAEDEFAAFNEFLLTLEGKQFARVYRMFMGEDVIDTFMAAMNDEAKEQFGKYLRPLTAANTNTVINDGVYFGTNGYYNVLSKKDWTLIPGAATETEMVLNNDSNTRRQVIHVIEVDPANPDVSIIPGYYNIDKDVSDKSNQFPMVLSKMAEYYESELGYKIVGGMNTDLTYAGDAPRVLVYNGEILGEGLGGNGSPSCYLGVYKDAEGNVSCMVKPFNRATLEAEVADGTLWNAVAVSFGMVVNDGQLVSKTEERTSTPASRSMVGVKEDGTLVICMNDGRGANNSIGFCNYEEGECMLALGCKWAANCDGGGSSTFISRRWGEEALSLRSAPSDGSERPTLHGVFVVSNAQGDGVFKSASFEPAEGYVTPNSVLTIKAIGTDNSGETVAIPAEATWQLSDESFGTIANGVFTSADKTGTVVAQLLYKGEVVGSMNINVVDIDTLVIGKTAAGEKNNILYVAPGTTTPIYLYSACGKNPVEIPAEEFTFTAVDALGNPAGSFDGFSFTAPKGRTDDLTMKVVYNKNTEITAQCTIRLSDTILINDDLETGNGIVNGSFKSTSLGENVQTSWKIVTAETGKVKNGNRAVAFTIDTTNGCGYGYFGLTAQPVNVDRQFTGAKKIGMWIYIPDNIPSLWVRISDTTGDMVLELIDTGELYREKYDVGAWHYFVANAEEYPNFIPGLIQFYVSDRDGAAAGYYMKDNCNPYTKFTLYFDDLFTMDRTYSSYDYYEPVFGEVFIEGTSGGFGTPLVRGMAQPVYSNTVSVYVNVEEDMVSAPYNASGLDYSSAKAYLDGNAIACTAFEGVIYADNISVSAGVHTVRFEISDLAGNGAVIERSFNVMSGTPALTLVPDNIVNGKILIGSVQWFKLVAADLASIRSASISLDLDGMNEWYVDALEVAEGFSVSSRIDEATNTLYLTFTQTGTPAATDVLARIPVHVWESKLSTFEGYESYTPQDLFRRGWVWPVSIVLKNGDVSRIVLTDGTVDSFSFDKMTFETELYGAYRELEKDGYVDGVRTCWHLHDFSQSEVVEDTPYYTKTRKYCAECNSWIYFLTEKNTDDPNYTGWKLIDGKWHYYVDGSEFTTYYGRNTSLEGYMMLPDRNGSGETLLYRCSIKSGVITGINEEPYTGAVPVADYTTEIYENGRLAKNKWVRVDDDDKQYWYYAGADGKDIADAATDSVAVVDGKLYSWLGHKTNNTNGRCTGLYSGNGTTYAYTTANQKKYSSNTFYLAGVVMDGWSTKLGVVYDKDGNKVTGFRNADGTPFVPTKAMMDDPSAFYGVYYFDDSGYLQLGANSIQYFFEAGNASSSRLYSTVNLKVYTEDWTRYGNGIINGFKPNGEGEGYLAPTVGSNKNLYYENGLPANGFRVTNSTSPSAVVYIHYAENGSIFKSKTILASDGYYYKTESNGRLLPTAGGTKAFDPRNATIPGEPLRDCRYTGAITGGYALYGIGYEGLKLVDGVLKNADDSLFNALVPNSFDKLVAYKDGLLVADGYAVIDGVLYKVENSVAKPFNGIYEGIFYLNGLIGEAEIFAEKYMLVNGKVYNVNADGSVGTEFSGIIDGVYYAEGLATDYEVIGGTKVKVDGIVYTVKYNGELGARFSGMIGEKRYISGVPANGWNGVYYYADGIKYVSTVVEIDGVYYGFDAAGRGAKQTGLFEMNGKLYYAIAGKLISGWIQVETGGEYYFFEQSTKAAISDGEHVFNGISFIFKDGHTAGTWHDVTDPSSGIVLGRRYYINAVSYHKAGGRSDICWAEIDGKTYGFDGNGYMYTGNCAGQIGNGSIQLFVFAKDGQLVGNFTDTGICYTSQGWMYYAVDGVLQKATWITDGDDLYYAQSGGILATGSCWIAKNGEYPGGTYIFGADGKLVKNNGLINGAFYENGIPAVNKWVTDGKDWYYCKSNALVATGSYWVRKTDDFPAGTYEFDATGKKVFTGIKDGVYYDKGVATAAGVISENGNFYYAGENGVLAKDTSIEVTAAKANGLIEAGTYAFDADGKLLLNGFCDGYYYKDGSIVKAAFIEDNGDIYYAKSNGTMATGSYWIAKNGEYPGGTYIFGADGKLVKNNGLINGAFYENGIPAVSKWVTDGKDWYYCKSNALVATGSYWVRKTDEFPAGTYEFDATGKKVFTGIKDGVYYDKSVPTAAGVVTEDGNFYYAGENGVLAKNTTIVVTVEKANGLIEAGTYSFDADGKLLFDGFRDGYYYRNGSIVKSDFIEDSGDIYYAKSSGKMATGSYWIAKTGAYPGGTYIFGADGKLVKNNGLINGAFYENGIPAVSKWVKDGTDWYYCKSNALVATGSYWVPKTEQFPAGTYQFDATGKKVFTGIKDGVYYDKSVPTAAGVVTEDGNFYYAGENGVLAKNTTIVVTVEKANGLIEAGTYSFDADGKLLFDGFRDGYYYRNGSIVKAAFIEDNGDIYYAKSNGTMATGSYWIAKNGEYPGGTYIFGADGKLVKNNGLINGAFYENGIPAVSKWVTDGKDWYYCKSNALVATGSYWVRKTDDFPAGTYEFDATGKKQ